MWISLTGFMGGGKSSVARHLGAELDWPVVDLDARIAKRGGRSIGSIFADSGEEGFRKLELECLQAVDPRRDLVIDTGGGLVETPEAVSLLRAQGPVFWLDVRWDQVRARLRGIEAERRPLVASLGWEGLAGRYGKRLVLYARAADFRLASLETGPEETARKVRMKLHAWHALQAAGGAGQ